MDCFAEDWQPLFNGRDLSGWSALDGTIENWAFADGQVICKGKSPGAEWLASDRTYADFELSLEYNLGSNGNSGIFLRAPKSSSPWVEGLEVQLLDDYSEKWKSLKPDQMNASIYAVVGPTKQATKKAGEWQSLQIRCVKRRLTVQLNGQVVQDVDLDMFADKTEQVPGLKRTAGHIGFQNHGDALAFRNVKVRVISTK